MPQYVKKIRTGSGDLKIDYEALANLPKLGALAPKNKVGKTDLAKDALDGYATTKYVDNAIKNIDIPDVDLTDYATKQYVESAIDSIIEPYSKGLSYNLKSNNEYTITGIGTCTDTDIVIPSIIGGKRVTSIGSQAFSGYSSLTSIDMPDSVKSIGEWAFYGCSSLTNVTIGNGVTSIGSYAFNECSSLTSVTIGNNVTSISERAFNNCYALTKITIPNSVTSIGNYAFVSCHSLTSITIPESVISIGERLFSNCNNLTIYCEAESKPEGWNTGWNLANRPVVWDAALDFPTMNERLNNKELYLYSSTEGSTKRFKLTIDDSGMIRIVEAP